MISVITCCMPLYGTFTMRVAVMILKSSMLRFIVLPLPVEPNINWSGLRLAYAISSDIEFTGSAGVIAITFGEMLVRITILKSLLTSYGTVASRLGFVASG